MCIHSSWLGKTMVYIWNSNTTMAPWAHVIMAPTFISNQGPMGLNIVMSLSFMEQRDSQILCPSQFNKFELWRLHQQQLFRPLHLKLQMTKKWYFPKTIELQKKCNRQRVVVLWLPSPTPTFEGSCTLLACLVYASNYILIVA